MNLLSWHFSVSKRSSGWVSMDMNPSPALRVSKMGALVLTTSLLLSACFPQLIRNEATTKIKDGNYETALTELQDGVKKYPDSIVLKAGLTSAKDNITTRLIAESAQLRNQGKYEDAEKALTRGLALDLNKEQFLSLQSDLIVEKRLQKRVVDSQNLFDSGKRDEALKLI